MRRSRRNNGRVPLVQGRRGAPRRTRVDGDGASALAMRVPKAGPQTACITPAPDREALVGVALSGGGSRAVLFGAAGLEALGRLQAPGGPSVLEQVAYLSKRLRGERGGHLLCEAGSRRGKSRSSHRRGR